MSLDLVPIVPTETVEGNTNLQPKKQVSPAKNWCFTFNNFEEKDISLLVSSFSSNCSKFIFENETGENGTPHLQGYILFDKKRRPSELKLNNKIHWEKCKGSEKNNIDYCSKDYRDKKEGCKIYKSNNIVLPVEVKIITELRPFQKSLLDILEAPVKDGKILWVVDEKGQLGKTQFLRYLNIKKGCPFTYGGKANDIINLVFNNKEYLLSNDKAIMIYNLPRETEPLKVSYKSMEQISDGAISNNKFEAGCFVCNPPHILVLANCEPIYERLTEGRIIIYTIDDNLNLIEA